MKFFIIILSLSCLVLASGYNLDVHNAEFFEDPGPSSGRTSYFGYSVALYSSGNDSLVLVGAPRAKSSRLPRSIEPGSVYLCTFKPQKNCLEWPVGDVDTPYSNSFHYNSYSWMGATIQVENSSKPVAAVCSPRWLYNLDRSPSGICYSKTIEAPTTFYNHENIKRSYFIINNYFEMTGFALHITPNKHYLLVGGRNRFNAFNPDSKDTSPISTYVMTVEKESENFGYSVTSGYFYEKGTLYYASGNPRGNSMTGEVTIIKENPHSQREKMTGSQLGEYFGSSLAACDLNDDGRDDLLVGAPFWSEIGDEGRLAVYLSINQEDFKDQSIRGRHPGARFGSAIACLGDLDHDGYGDVAVGAPYEDDHGAVYIFNGGADGPKSFSQRIRGSELRGGLRAFGASISAPRDVDGNGYADVAVGAYLSGRAVLLKSRPVVVLGLTKLAPPRAFSLTENSTQLPLDVCVRCGGAFVRGTLKVNFTLVFDKRVYVHEKSINTYNETNKILAINEETCFSVVAALEPLNVLEPIEIDANISVDDDPSCQDCPVINPNLSKLNGHAQVAFALECGSDGICEAALVVKISSNLGANNSYVVGSKSNASVTVLVKNTGEPAYDTFLHIDVPDPILVSKLPSECYEQSKLNGTLRIQCKVGNPLRRTEKMFYIGLDMSAIQYFDNAKTIDVKAETRSNDSVQDNTGSLKILFYANASVAVSGKARESLYSYFELEADDTSTENITFEHIYEIQKFNVSPIEEVTFLLRVPTHWKGVKIAAIKEMESQVDGVQNKKAAESSIPLVNPMFRFKAENVSFHSGENRTFYVNCTNVEIECRTFLWTLGPFRKPQSSAKVSVKFELLLSNRIATAVKGKDIFFVSEATVNITKSNTIMARKERPNYKQLSTFFIHRAKSETVAVWIIVLSVLLGVALVTLTAGMLYKLGFFKRKRVGDLQNLTNERLNVRDDID